MFALSLWSHLRRSFYAISGSMAFSGSLMINNLEAGNTKDFFMDRKDDIKAWRHGTAGKGLNAVEPGCEMKSNRRRKSISTVRKYINLPLLKMTLQI